ncbi:MAG TPA: hypothetical protein PLA74_00925 [Syntrophales bacterium]|nr:hypothetical protein [Syntrophales bacterium]HPQ44995.1 hypothetical protein [Syntrophales bacterium]
MRKNQFIILVLLGVFVVTLVGCSQSEGDEKALKESVTREWQAKVNKDWNVVYDLTTDAFKKTMDRDFFLQKANVNVLEYSIKEITVTESGKKALAVIAYKHNHKNFEFNTTSRENWVWENGGWRLELDANLVPK